MLFFYSDVMSFCPRAIGGVSGRSNQRSCSSSSLSVDANHSVFKEKNIYGWMEEDVVKYEAILAG